MKKNKVSMEKIVNLCKTRGFVFPGSEIYDGFANTWDFGPLGVELENNIKKVWWKYFVQKDRHTYGLDSSILMNPKVWEASGHLASFGDPKMDCKKCKQRFRADNLVDNYSNGEAHAEGMSNEELEQYIDEHNINCPNCGAHDWTKIRKFNPMFSTTRGTLEETADKVYLRPETCQGQYINFLNVQRVTGAKVPFAVAQIGKSFRNEVTPGNFLFRTIEFEQMEHQLFCHPNESMDEWLKLKDKSWNFLLSLGVNPEHIRFHNHDKLAHYAKAACDIEYLFPMGWEELHGIHHRGDWDLSRHQQYSGKSMTYTDPYTNEKYIPNVIEYSFGVGRCALCVLCESYKEQELKDGEIRSVLSLHPALAPYKVAVLPLHKNLNKKALEVYDVLSDDFMCTYEEKGSIGKRYRKQDEIGTPLCVTVDFDSINDNCVTIRDRDTMEQRRMPIDEIVSYIQKAIKY